MCNHVYIFRSVGCDYIFSRQEEECVSKTRDMVESHESMFLGASHDVVSILFFNIMLHVRPQSRTLISSDIYLVGNADITN